MKDKLGHIEAQFNELLIRRYFNSTGELPPHGHICYGYSKEYQDSQRVEEIEEIPIKKPASVVKFTKRNSRRRKTSSVNSKAQAFGAGDKFLSSEFKTFLERTQGQDENGVPARQDSPQ